MTTYAYEAPTSGTALGANVKWGRVLAVVLAGALWVPVISLFSLIF